MKLYLGSLNRTTLFYDVKTAFNAHFFSLQRLAVLTRFVVMLALNLWVTVTVLRYRRPVAKAE